MTQARGFILYRGPSLLDGAPIVAIATMHSKNTKTGDMVQIWIIREDVPPMAALDSGADASICGNCPHRRGTGGACYVDVSRAPSVVWKAYQRGAYGEHVEEGAAQRAATGRMVRLGAYGDPAAVPADVWATLIRFAKGHTGYTHQWGNESLRPGQWSTLKALVMASCDSGAEAENAQRQGWRTFRVHGNDDAAPLARESVCPASAESTAKRKLTCAECGACDGSGFGRVGESHRHGSIRINVHGSLAKRFIPVKQA